MKNIYVFIIAIAYCFAVRANQFTKKFVRRSACSLGESRELRMLYVLSVILSTISFWRFVFLFCFTILFGDIQSTNTIFCDIQR